MELEILISKKGTKVVKASSLHQALGLPVHHFAINTRKWLKDVYEFSDGIRSPEILKDFAPRQVQESFNKDYFLSIELAKRIALNTNSRYKLKIANRLANSEDSQEIMGMLSVEQVMAVMELTKVMGLVSCQMATEKEHHKTYEDRNNGNPSNWWNFRRNVFGYSTEDLKKSLRKLGIPSKSKSQRQMLMQLDKYEMIRVAVIDLFMALGKSESFALMIGDMAKVFARELKIEIFDDRDVPLSLFPDINQDLVDEIRNLNKAAYRHHWESLRMAS